MKAYCGFLMLTLSGLLLAGGCGSGGSDCSGLNNPCSSEGQLRCSAGLEAVERCTRQDGCLVWQTSQDCASSGQVCVDSGDGLTCGENCSDDCPGQGRSRCLNDTVQTCAQGTDGCLHWIDDEDCSASGQTCTDDGQQARCSGGCTPDCTSAGDSRCHDNVVQTCSDDGSGCLLWTDDEDCSASGKTCNDDNAQAVCVEGCSSNCPQAGDSRCQGFVLQLCSDVGAGCLQWTDSSDCLDDGLSCHQVDASTAECSSCEPPDIGCNQDEHCVMLTEYVFGCLPAGPGAAGDDCSSSDCGPGLQCFDFDDGYRCRVLCSNTSDCDEQSHCIWPWLETTEDWGICRPGCDPIRQTGCNQDEACYFEDPDVGSTLCWTAGNLEEGATCSMSDLCAPGLDCILEPDSNPFEYYCRAYCDPEHPCTGGQTCTALPPGMPLQKVCH